MHADDCFDVRTVAFNFIAIKWKTVDDQIAAFDRDKIKCTDDVVWCQKNCTWSQCSQMHWRNCLIVRLLHLILMLSNARWRLFNRRELNDVDCTLKCQKNCIWFRTIKCIDRIVCDQKLHLMSMSLNVLTKLFDCQTTAFDRETIRCMLTIVYNENSLIRRFSRWNAYCQIVKRTNCWFNVKKIASDFERSNALTKLFDVCWCCRLTD